MNTPNQETSVSWQEERAARQGGSCNLATEAAALDDPDARRLLKTAAEATYRWDESFPGFTAQLVYNHNGALYTGTVTARSSQDVQVSLDFEEGRTWVKNQIASLVGHRQSRTFEESDGKYILTLGEEDSHPLGRQVFLHGDPFNSVYRIKDNRILQIYRNMGKIQFTINIDDTITTDDGRFLTSHFIVYYFGTDPSGLRQVESFKDNYQRVGEFYLPQSRRIHSALNSKVITQELILTQFSLL